MSLESKNAPGQGAAFVVAQLGLLALIALGPRQLGPEWTAPWAALAAAAGVALGLAGASLTLAGALHLGRNLTPFPRPREDAILIRSGAYRLVRHPIYSGLILAAFGWALFVGGVLTLLYALALLVLMDAKTRHEERWLIAKFEEYGDYKRRVRRLIPYLY